MSEDPIGFGGGDPNLSRYITNSTTTSIDPDGLERKPTLPASGRWSDPAKPGNSTFYFSDPSMPPIEYVNNHPNFEEFIYRDNASGILAEVKIHADCDLTKTDKARRAADIANANGQMNEILGGRWQLPGRYTWHHQWVDGKGLMQMILVPTQIHQKAIHDGGFYTWTQVLKARQAGDKVALRAAHQFRRTLGYIEKVAKRGLPTVAAYCTFNTALEGWAADGASGAFHAVMKDAMYDAEVRALANASADYVGRTIGVDNGDVMTRKRLRAVGGIIDPTGHLRDVPHED